jgi:sec-independent protein translocase protein TatA
MNEWLNIQAFGMPGATELIIIAVIGLLIFGKRLPEVGKSLGKSIVEFKKGLRGIEDDIDRAVEQDQNDMLPPPEQPASSSSTATATTESDQEKSDT